MSELDLRLHCVALAVQSLKEHTDPNLVQITARCIYSFLEPANAGRGVERDAANCHPAHPTIQ